MKNQRNRMSNINIPWKKVFLFCLGLFIGTSFCMKWIEQYFLHNGSLFTIIGLEISYSKEQVATILSGIDPEVKTLLRSHLYFDFVFMMGVYPGIAALCMMAISKTHGQSLKKILLLAACMQPVAFACDLVENLFLLKWIAHPDAVSQFQLYHLLVIIKWVLALAGALLAIPLSLKKVTRLKAS